MEATQEKRRGQAVSLMGGICCAASSLFILGIFVSASPAAPSKVTLQVTPTPLTNSVILLWQPPAARPVPYLLPNTWQGIEKAERINESLMKRYQERLERSSSFKSPFTRSLPPSTLAEAVK